jgi:hypothetical protein
VQGVFLTTTQPYSTKGTAGAFEFYVPDPIASPLSKSLEAACHVQDTHGTEVVMPAYEHTVVVKKKPPALYTPSNTISLGKVLLKRRLTFLTFYRYINHFKY